MLISLLRGNVRGRKPCEKYRAEGYSHRQSWFFESTLMSANNDSQQVIAALIEAEYFYKVAY
jgi:hypothetical protein